MRHLTARDLRRPPASANALEALRERALAWEPLTRVLALQHGDILQPGNGGLAAAAFSQRCGICEKIAANPLLRVLREALS